MVAALVPPVELLPDGLYSDAVGRLLAAAFDLWVQDAARWLRLGDDVPARDRRRCESAWRLIELRPRGCPLISIASSLADADEATVWAWLWSRAVDSAGL